MIFNASIQAEDSTIQFVIKTIFYKILLLKPLKLFFNGDEDAMLKNNETSL
jgi:hypothetical protein